MIEPLFLNAEGLAVREGRLNLPARGDVYSDRRGLVRIDSKNLLSFESFDVSGFGRTKITVSPFYWDYCSLVCKGLPLTRVDDGIANWFLKWVDIEDVKPVASSGLREVVHFTSDPEETSAGVRIEFDFGSAPIEAFETVIEAMVALMPHELAVGAS